MSIGNDVNTENKKNAAYNFHQLEYWNPFIESIPDKLTKSELFAVLKSEPIFDIEEKRESSNIRSHYINRLYELFVPLQSHFSVYEFIYGQLDQGYRNRYSRISDYYVSLSILGDLKRNYEDTRDLKLCKSIEVHDRGNQINTIEGIENNGKSLMIDKILSVFPQVIRHRSYKNLPFIKTQVVWIKVDYPFDGALKTLCINIFKYFDEILESDFVSKFGHSKNTAELMLIQISHLLSLYSVGLLVLDNLDEIHLSTNKHKYLLSSINKLSCISNVPITTVISNKLGVIKLLEEQVSFSENGLVFSPFAITDEIHKFIDVVWKFQWIKFDENIELEYKKRLLYYSHGTIGRMIEFHRDVQEHALNMGIEVITEEFIELLYQENLLQV